MSLLLLERPDRGFTAGYFTASPTYAILFRMLSRCAVLVLLISILALATASLAKKKPGSSLQQNPGQTADLSDPPFFAAAQKCENWAWAAGVQTILKAQGVNIRQNYWIQKANAGELCVETPMDLGDIASVIDGDYVLDDGDKVHLDSRVAAGAPTDVGMIVASIKLNRPLLLFWKSHAYLVEGITYDEYLYPNGQRMLEAREIRLVDPYDKKPASFVKGQDDASEISGTLEVIVGPITHWR
ncbi:MAG TPA: hypothetical protein VEG30_11825 [Terriglobales bacterium]|nr:hypothetical protein [Terriglobales bacterium]